MNNIQKQRGSVNVFLIALVVIFVGVVGYLTLIKKSPDTVNTENNNLKEISLSEDKKNVSFDNKVVLAIDDSRIFNWFKTNSQLCDESNLNSNSDREMFCENQTSFKNQTRFISIDVSPDKMKIGFTIESDALSPDTVVGVFSLSDDSIDLFGNYYLGNEFISFSPNGTNFVYKGDCFEGMCALHIKDSETLVDVASISDSEFPDARTMDVTFVKWLSDNSIEYQLGAELKQISF